MKYTILIFAFIALVISQESCCRLQTLSVQGNGRVSIDPDIASLTLYANADGKTSAEALSKVNGIIQKATVILQTFGLPKANYTTSSINLNPQYNYTQSGYAILIGQQASVSLTVTTGNLNSKNRVGALYTALSNINNISISGLTFDTSNKAVAFRRARKEAVADARSKAEQYVRLGLRSLGRVKKVEDRTY